MKIGVIIPAGGASKRFGGVYKPLLKIGSKTMLEMLIDRLNEINNISEIVIAVHREYVNKIKKLTSSRVNVLEKNTELIKVVEGGKERKFSVYNAFKRLGSNIDVVVIHDAARPTFDIKLLNDMLKKIKYCDAIIPVKPIPDTVKLVNNNYVDRTVDRSKLFLSLTPQVFKKSILEYAYKKININKYMITDEAQLLEIAGKKVSTIIHTSYNIKVTYPDDYTMVKHFLRTND